jgi:hypothetical protein
VYEDDIETTAVAEPTPAVAGKTRISDSCCRGFDNTYYTDQPNAEPDPVDEKKKKEVIVSKFKDALKLGMEVRVLLVSTRAGLALSLRVLTVSCVLAGARNTLPCGGGGA